MRATTIPEPLLLTSQEHHHKTIAFHQERSYLERDIGHQGSGRHGTHPPHTTIFAELLLSAVHCRLWLAIVRKQSHLRSRPANLPRSNPTMPILLLHTQASADTAPSALSTDSATASSGGSVSAGTGRRQANTASRILGVSGVRILTIGTVIMLFVIYEAYWTNIQSDHEQSQAKSQLDDKWANARTPLMPTRAKPWESCASPPSVRTGTTPLSRGCLPVTSAAGPGTTPELKTPGTREASRSPGTVSAEAHRLMTGVSQNLRLNRRRNS